MKKNYMKTLFIALLFLGIRTANSQCSANFIYTIGGSGNVTFTSTSVGTTSNTIYNWTFGDGNYATNFNNIFANNVYSSNGTFVVNLFIYDTISVSTCSAGISQTINISNAACGGTASFSGYPGSGGVYNYYSTSTGIAPNSTYFWNFGDGNTLNSGTTGNSAHTYTASGNYSVTMVVTDPLSICSYTTVQTISVTVASCSLTASYTYTNGAAGYVYFVSTSTITSGTTNYYWNFGDGFYGSGVATNHTYASNGIYNVQLQIYDSISFACSSNLTQTITISNVPCVAVSSFSVTKDSSVAFTWKAWPAYSPNILAASWNWGDGNTSLGLYPSHTYSAAGMYSICLSVTVSCTTGTLSSTTCVNSNIYKMIAGTGSASMVYINVINASAAGIKEVKSSALITNLYPNPNNGNFTIDISNIDAALKDLELNLYNVIGEKVFNSHLNPLNGKVSSDLNLETLPNGTYFVKIQGMSKTNKVVIMR